MVGIEKLSPFGFMPGSQIVYYNQTTGLDRDAMCEPIQFTIAYRHLYE
jgi:hypothetical protein